jgi:hypothetical protein
MNEHSNSSAGWSTEKSGPNRAHLPAAYPENDPAEPPRSEQRLSDSAYDRAFQKSTSDATTARPSLVAPASCRRFSAQALRSTFLGNLRPARPSASTILIDTPKRLEFAVSPTKQTSRPISNRVKITGYCETLFEFSFVAPASCRRISAPFTSRKIAVKMPVLPRAEGTFLTGTPKQLEITVIHRKQTLASISNRDTNSGSGVAGLDRYSAAGPGFVRHHYPQNETRCISAYRPLLPLPIARESKP